MISTNLIMAIAVASVATTLVTGVVYADEKNGKPFEEIWKAIHEMELTLTNEITDVNREEIIDEPIPRGLSSISVPCEEGDIVLGGGYEIPDGVVITADKPDGETGWFVGFKTFSSSKEVAVYAICATP